MGLALTEAIRNQLDFSHNFSVLWFITDSIKQILNKELSHADSLTSEM